MKSGMENLVKNAADPQYVAKILIDAIMDKNPKMRYFAGKDIEEIMNIKNKICLISIHIFNWLYIN